MHGKGEFKHATDGTVLKGYFAKNLYLCSKNGKRYFLNPLDTSVDHQKFITKSDESKKLEEDLAVKKSEDIRIFKVDTVQKLNSALADSK